MYTKVNVVKPGDNKGVGGNKKNRIIIFDMDDVLTYPARNADGITVDASFVMNPGAYMVSLYATQSTIKTGSDAEGDPDAKGIIQNLEFDHPGNSVEIRAFRQYWMNRNIGAIVESCDGTSKEQLGTPCAPLQLAFKFESSKDKSVTSMTFKSTQKGPEIAEYNGSSTFDTINATLAAGATSVDLATGDGQYQTTSGVAAPATIATLTNPAAGIVFTLLGSGGAFPTTIAATATFLLANGTAWTALSGSSITFRVIQTGGSTYAALEQSRT